MRTEKITMFSCERMDGMSAWFRWDRCGWFVVLILLSATGCVERRMVIATDPYGAIVYDEKNHPIGAAPVDRTFTFYGTYRFRLAKDGYETLVVEEKVRAPWYECFGLDFISENLIPWTIRDVRYFRYKLQPAQVVPMGAVLQQAQTLRDYGKTIGVPLPGPAGGLSDLPAGNPPARLMPPAVP